VTPSPASPGRDPRIPVGDIHRVLNTGNSMAISMHVYGADISRLGNRIRREYPLLLL
jgi:predicted metal-dependent enzyme (double-stranded beta helix superfamily)